MLDDYYKGIKSYVVQEILTKHISEFKVCYMKNGRLYTAPIKFNTLKDANEYLKTVENIES